MSFYRTTYVWIVYFISLYEWTIVWLVYLIFPEKTDFIGLSMGSFLPDFLEPVMMFIFSPYYWLVRSITHSIFGVLTIDLLVSGRARNSFCMKSFAGFYTRKGYLYPWTNIKMYVKNYINSKIRIIYYSFNSPFYFPLTVLRIN